MRKLGINPKTWTPEQNKVLGEMLKTGPLTDARAFLEGYRTRAGDGVHNAGAFVTKVYAVAGVLGVDLSDDFRAGLRDIVREERAEKAEGPPPAAQPSKYQRVIDNRKPALPACAPDDAWITAGEVGQMFDKSHWWVAGHANELGLVRVFIPANGHARVGFYLRSSAAKAAEVWRKGQAPKRSALDAVREQYAHDKSLPDPGSEPARSLVRMDRADDYEPSRPSRSRGGGAVRADDYEPRRSGGVRSAPTREALEAAWRSGALSDGEYLAKLRQLG